MASSMGLLAKIARLSSVAVVICGSAGMTFVAISAWRLEVSLGDRSPPGTESAVPDSVNPFPSGEYLVAFVIGASDCDWSTKPTVLDAVAGIRESLRSTHVERFAGIRVVGIAIDSDLDQGLEFLEKLRKRRAGLVFDQISVGGSWLNEVVARLIYRDGLAQPLVPQVVVLTRSMDTRSYLHDGDIEVSNERLVLDLKGGMEIARWVKQGTPLT